ncbi:hypothetical protein [Paractinoplanes durhamensis]|uniref:hypothetical protein n=1 Tax=Paractinoplanes durhamensis TaxID=113563 RepID=UPI0036443755
MTEKFEIRPAREDELATVGALISQSFFHLGACVYLVPPVEDRLKVHNDYFTLLTEHAHNYGRVDVIDDPSGDGLAATAVWFDYTREAPDPPNYDERLQGLAGSTSTGSRRSTSSSPRTTRTTRTGTSRSWRSIRTARRTVSAGS